MKKYEYMTVDLSAEPSFNVHIKLERYIEKLNEYGKQGWRLISGTDDWKYSIFEREIDDVVPPLEGLWWQENTPGLDYARKEDMHFISMIRLPDFVTKEDFEWAVQEATKKKKQDFSKVEFFPYDEGMCVTTI